MFKNENQTLENKQIEVGHGKKPRVDAKDKFKKKQRERKKRKKIEGKKEKRRRDLNYIMSVGIFGQTSCGKKCY